MAKSFRVDVVSPEATVWSGDAEFLVARTVDGEIGILADHEPLMAALATGAVMIESGSDKINIGVHGGFLQVLANHVTLLTDRAQISEQAERDQAAKLAEDLRAVEEQEQGEEAD